MTTIEPTSFSPKSFLKARRPERFSDTIVKEATELDRSLLEFHLSSLTSRSQETEFEKFAHRLCEREICPNLLPQTGPTGGGDSKVDSETYPVSDKLSLAWYVGLANGAAQERWAFAFSAKQKWRSKVQSDIAKIAGTNRGYVKAFFITNQAVPDRKRAEVEDGLRSEHGIDVRILDRTWILDRVFEGGHEEIAISELGVSALTRRKIIRGPLDAKRESRLDETEKRIREALQTGRYGSALVEDAIDAADLSRALERSRVEIEGRYDRVDKLSLKYGTFRQQVEVSYQWAWTLFWWFEDFEGCIEKYRVVENRVRGSRNVYDLERLTALWYCLQGIVSRREIDAQTASYSEHTDILIAELERLRTEKDRPSTALQAETLVLEVQIAIQLFKGKPADNELRSLQDVILQSEGLVGYPLERLVERLTEIGKLLEGLAAYDELFETILRVTSNRDGEIKAARLLLIRGEGQLSQGRCFQAIATLGRALGWLYKHETRHEIVKALYLCGCAYDEVGLPWASRGTLLSAASIATDELWRYGDVTPYQAACYRRLKWIELRLGRLPHILAWHELDVVVRHELVERGYDPEKILADDPAFNAQMIRLLLHTDFFDLRALCKLPDVLDSLGLDLAADALLYALGHKERFEEVAKHLDEDPDLCACKWRKIKADVPLPDRPVLYNQMKVLLESRVIGCQIIVESSTEPPCVEVAESILAALESFLATSALNRAIAHEPILTIEVSTSDFAESLISDSVEERAGRPHLSIRCRKFDPHDITNDEKISIREAILHAVLTALSHFVVFKDFERDLEALFRDERVSERAVAFTSTFVTQANVLGASPKTRLESWIDEKAKTYPLRRTEPWEPQEIGNGDQLEKNEKCSRLIQGAKPRRELLDQNLRSHDQIETVSIIRERLWDRAGWTGTAFLTDPANEYPPVFALVFRNHEAGREIFVHWRKEIGEVDDKELIRIVIVRGIDKRHPHAYRVVVGSDPGVFSTDRQFVTFINRVHRMDATTPENLERFLSAYVAVAILYIAPAFAGPDFDGSQAPEVEMGLRIGVHHIHVRNAWKIGRNDIDSAAIHEGDDPIIPENVEGAPVLKLIGSRRAG